MPGGQKGYLSRIGTPSGPFKAEKSHSAKQAPAAVPRKVNDSPGRPLAPSVFHDGFCGSARSKWCPVMIRRNDLAWIVSFEEGFLETDQRNSRLSKRLREAVCDRKTSSPQFDHGRSDECAELDGT